MANVLLAVAFAAPAAAQPSPSEPAAPPGEQAEINVPEPIPGEPVCQITDPRLNELSGLAAVDDGYIVINDSVPPGRDDMLPIFFLNQNCEVVGEQGYFPGRPLDPEDLEYDWSRNVLWIGDTGDNQALGTSDGQPRPTVALWRVDLDGDRTPLIHRFRYPDGQPRDAEALILDNHGMPIIITRNVGVAELFRPPELAPNNPPEQAVTLERVGEFTPPDTGSEHSFLPSAAARRTVTGASAAPDGTRVVVRTYTDAFEFDVLDGDVAAAITTGVPRVTPLPDEPQGEAITYTPDGEQFLTVSEVPGDAIDFTPQILSDTPTPPAPPAPEPADDESPPTAAGGGFSLFNSVQSIINLIAAVGVLGLLLVVAGVIGIVRARRRAAAGGDRDALEGADPQQPSGPATGRARPMGAEGRARPPGAATPPGGEARAAGERAGGVDSSSAARGGEPGYEGTEYGGTEYGGAGTQGTAYHGDPYQGGAYQSSGHQGGEYRGAEYGGGREYRGAEYGGGRESAGYAQEYPEAGYPATEPGGGSYQDATYAEAGYGDARYGPAGQPDGYAGDYRRADEPFDQDWHPGQAAQGHRSGDGYAEGPYEQAGYGYPAAEGAGTYQGGGYESNRQEAPDYYSDDPDYPYEFRDRDR